MSSYNLKNRLIEVSENSEYTRSSDVDSLRIYYDVEAIIQFEQLVFFEF